LQPTEQSYNVTVETLQGLSEKNLSPWTVERLYQCDTKL